MGRILETPTSFLEVDKCDQELLELLKSKKEELKAQLERRPKIIVYNKEVEQPRNVGFFSDTIQGYNYSKKVIQSKPLTKELKQILNYINKKYAAEFNGILINYYKDGNDYIGMHCDNEEELDKIGVVSLSIGATRKFRIRTKQKKIVLDYQIKKGDILLMAGTFQEEFYHEIPKQKTVKEERISLTFRKHQI